MVDLPDVKARFEILKFHIDRLQNNARLASDVTETVLAMIAESTMGYSGANLKQIVQKAILLGIQRVSMVI
jgi:SpoVK/Ycf46/Vps4 family AAA+-type ATPase